MTPTPYFKTYPNQYYNYSSTGSTTAHILLPNGTPVATVEADGSATSTYYLHLDHLGSTHTITDTTGSEVETTDYYPFGEQRVASSTSGFTEQKKFTGHEYDTDSDLTYAKARYYDQDVGRFLSQDVVFKNMAVDERTKALLRDPQLQNAYAYSRNNPLTYLDPNGEHPAAIVGGLFYAGVLVYSRITTAESYVNWVDAEFLSRSEYTTNERNVARFDAGFNTATGGAITVARRIGAVLKEKVLFYGPPALDFLEGVFDLNYEKASSKEKDDDLRNSLIGLTAQYAQAQTSSVSSNNQPGRLSSTQSRALSSLVSAFSPSNSAQSKALRDAISAFSKKK
jgi:RHS repeat-associated protein